MNHNNLMLSVAVGDICGSIYELRGYGTKNYEEVNLLRDDTDYTDDTICAFACAEALLKGIDVGKNLWERCQPEIKRGFGNRFRHLLAFLLVLSQEAGCHTTQGTAIGSLADVGRAVLVQQPQFGLSEAPLNNAKTGSTKDIKDGIFSNQPMTGLLLTIGYRILKTFPKM